MSGRAGSLRREHKDKNERELEEDEWCFQSRNCV